MQGNRMKKMYRKKVPMLINAILADSGDLSKLAA